MCNISCLCNIYFGLTEVVLFQAMEKLIKEYTEKMGETEQKMVALQKELNESKHNFQEQVNKIHHDKEKQLQQVYTR